MRPGHALAIGLILVSTLAVGQAPPDPSARTAAQREAMSRLSFMDGVWRGPAWSLTPAGRHEVVQTERVGPFLDGAVRVVEGRAYRPDGSVAFNALGVISFDPSAGTYSMSSWAMGHSVSATLNVSGDVVTWETPAGPGAVIRHTATIRNGLWHEVSERIAGDAPPMRVAELNLSRMSDTSWPAADPVPAR